MTHSDASQRRREIQARVMEVAAKTGRSIAKNYLMKECERGYKTAAEICLTVVGARTDELVKRMESGKKLSASEQDLLSNLMKLKSETQEALAAEWEVVAREYR